MILQKWTLTNIFPNGFLNYFENDFTGNVIKSLKFPSSTATWWDFSLQTDLEKLANNFANKWLNIFIKIKYDKVRLVPVEAFSNDEAGIYNLRHFICEQVQHTLLNKNIYERVNASQENSAGGNTISSDTSAYVWVISMLSKEGQSYLQNTEIDQWEWIGEDEVFYQTRSGNIIEIKGKADLSLVEDLQGVL